MAEDFLGKEGVCHGKPSWLAVAVPLFLSGASVAGISWWWFERYSWRNPNRS